MLAAYFLFMYPLQSRLYVPHRPNTNSSLFGLLPFISFAFFFFHFLSLSLSRSFLSFSLDIFRGSSNDEFPCREIDDTRDNENLSDIIADVLIKDQANPCLKQKFLDTVNEAVLYLHINYIIYGTQVFYIKHS